MSMTRPLLPRPALQDLLDALQLAGFECIGPTVRDGAIVYDNISQLAELPRGIRDQQQPGQYRLAQHDDEHLFAWANGPQALKPFLFRPQEPLWSVEKGPTGQLSLQAHQADTHKRAMLGVRACDIAALYLHDSHFLQADFKDPYYLAQRQELLIIAVNCTHPAASCFCASTGDGPRAAYGYDLAMTELVDGFVVEAHSEAGTKLLATLELPAAPAETLALADDLIEQATTSQQRALPGRELQQALFDNLDHPQWDNIASRCLSCGNCTAVCPSCFCHSEAEQGGLDLTHSEHIRQWDSCFSAEHSYIHGMTIRSTTAQRYRQWLTHKLGSWHEQYGRAGCVGCGRCISWCPAGIDLTAEVRAIIAEAGHG